jgi:flagellar motor protein MotB
MRWLLVSLCLSGCGARSTSRLDHQLESEVQALNQVVRDLRHQVSTCGSGSSPDAIFADLTQLFSGTEIEVTREGAVTIVVLPASVLFSDPYGLRMRQEATMALDFLATSLQVHDKHRVVLVGHTDNRMLPKAWVRAYSSHLELSFEYAAAVMQALSETYEVHQHRFTVSAQGHWGAIASNDTAAGQARNNRVEVHILPQVITP